MEDIRSTMSLSTVTLATMTNDTVASGDDDVSNFKESSPIDLEALIQSQRIAYILNSSIYKTKIVTVLPFLIRDKILESILSPEDLGTVTRIFYERCQRKSYFKCRADMEALSKGILSKSNRLSPYMSNLIAVLLKYPELREVVDSEMEKCSEELSIAAMNFLNHLMQLRDSMIERCDTPAMKLIEKEVHRRKIFNLNLKHLSNIEDLKAQLKEEQDQFESKLRNMQEKIERLKNEYQNIFWKMQSEEKRIFVVTDRELVVANRELKNRVSSMKENFQSYEKDMKEIQEEHLETETQKRDKVKAAGNRHREWLDLYDADMSKRQDELEKYEELTREYKDKVASLEDKIKELDKEYLPLMAARNAEYDDEMRGKMNQFMETRASRLLQYVWRLVLSNREEKRRLKRLAGVAGKKRGK